MREYLPILAVNEPSLINWLNQFGLAKVCLLLHYQAPQLMWTSEHLLPKQTSRAEARKGIDGDASLLSSPLGWFR